MRSTTEFTVNEFSLVRKLRGAHCTHAQIDWALVYYRREVFKPHNGEICPLGFAKALLGGGLRSAGLQP